MAEDDSEYNPPNRPDWLKVLQVVVLVLTAVSLFCGLISDYIELAGVWVSALIKSS